MLLGPTFERLPEGLVLARKLILILIRDGDITIQNKTSSAIMNLLITCPADNISNFISFQILEKTLEACLFVLIFYVYILYFYVLIKFSFHFLL